MPGFSALNPILFLGSCSLCEHRIDVCHGETTCNPSWHIVRLTCRSPCLMPHCPFSDRWFWYFHSHSRCKCSHDWGCEIIDRHFDSRAFSRRSASDCHFDLSVWGKVTAAPLGFLRYVFGLVVQTSSFDFCLRHLRTVSLNICPFRQPPFTVFTIAFYFRWLILTLRWASQVKALSRVLGP